MTTAPPVSSDRSTAMTRARTNHRPGSAGITEQRADVLTESQPGTAASTTPAEPAPCTADRHGDEHAYTNARCRCTDAREAHRVHRGRRHLRLIRQGPALVPAAGTVRRLRALAAIGYSVEDIGVGIGCRPSYVGQLQHTTRRVNRRTVEKVCAFYQRHADHRGPSPRAIHYAARNGWLSPMWWDDDTIDVVDYEVTNDFHAMLDHIKTPVDEVAIMRYLADDTTVSLTRAEKRAAFHSLRAAGHSITAAANTLRLSGSTARRYDAADAGRLVLPAVHTADVDNLEATG